MARELVAQAGGTDGLTLLGIHRRGVQVAEMIRDSVEKIEKIAPPLGTLDITFHRDDLALVGPRPVVGPSQLPDGGVDGRTVVLIDDVIFSGRSVRAAVNELMDWGRPERVLLAVLVDRGGRELPIQPDVVGMRVEVSPRQRVDLHVPELDGSLGVVLVDR
jgi:pyrimidine operon attenuation protein/uracil phosphoribosyltransferase